MSSGKKVGYVCGVGMDWKLKSFSSSFRQNFGNLQKRGLEIPLPSSKKELGSFSLLSNLFKKAVPKYLPFHAPLGVVVIDCSCRILIDIASNDHKTTTAKLPKVFLDLFQKVDTKSGHLTSPIFLYSAQKFWASKGKKWALLLLTSVHKFGAKPPFCSSNRFEQKKGCWLIAWTKKEKDFLFFFSVFRLGALCLKILKKCLLLSLRVALLWKPLVIRFCP